MEPLSFHIPGLWDQWLWPILQFVIGLGLVIFIHELGHFTVAKITGIKVEQFALGFGPRLFGFKTDETDYCVNILPLGGYVKMVGQEDFRPLEEQDNPDPRAFNNKPVSTRFGVISAGVAMNIILACVMFIIVCIVGIRFPAPNVGGSLLGFPAHDAAIRWQTHENPAGRSLTERSSQGIAAQRTLPSLTFGLQPGDRILKVGGEGITRFSQLAVIAALANRHEKFKVTIERQVDGKTYIGTTVIGVMPEGGHLSFGLIPALSTTLGGVGNYMARDPFREGDRIIAINDQKILHHWQIAPIEQQLSGNRVTATLLRRGKELDIELQPNLRIDTGVFFLRDGTAVKGDIVGFSDKDKAVLKVPNRREKKLIPDQVIWPAKSELLDIVGLVPRLKIAGVIKNSPADAAGLKPGDIVQAYGGKDTPTIKQFLETNDQVAEEGTKIVLVRDIRRLPPIEIRPQRHKGRLVLGILQGLDEQNPVIAHVREGSPAAKAGLISGDIFTKVNEREVGTWIELFNALKESVNKNVTISYRRDNLPERTARIGILTSAVFDPEDYRYILFPGPRGFFILMGKEVKKNPLAAIVWGANETWDFIRMTYATLESYFKGTVSYKAFSGPVGIATIAIQAGREGFSPFMYFMAMISVSLAVLNFLPIPVVDGGHALFLLIEKIRGKPLPLKVQNSIAMVGWALLLFVFFAVTWNDIGKILRNLWWG